MSSMKLKKLKMMGASVLMKLGRMPQGPVDLKRFKVRENTRYKSGTDFHERDFLRAGKKVD